jgi:thiamine biosynthesis protein ThiS
VSVCTVNGKAYELEDGETVARLLERLGLESRYVLVERNGGPVNRNDYQELLLAPDDTILVARPVAGG